jgi:hypothetical protein
MFGVFSELTFFGKLTFWRLTISPSIANAQFNFLLGSIF